MGDGSDFTFCQVGAGVNEDIIESPRTIPDIGVISLKEIPLGSVAINKVVETIEDDGCEIAKLRDGGGWSSPTSKPEESHNQGVAAPADGSVEVEKQAAKKTVARKKVPFEKGFSQMDWLKLARTHPDLAGLKGQSSRRLISMDEVRQHKTEGSIWTVLKGRVYNISPYMKFHPGGVDLLMKAAGKDCTSLFNKYHAWVNADFLLEKCLVGILDVSP